MTAHPPFARRSGLIALAALTLVGAACGPAPTPTPEPAAFDGRLLVHLGRPEPIQLIGIDGHGIEREVTTPEGGLRWFAAAPDGHLAGIGGDGTVLVADGDGEGWQAVALDDVPTAAESADVRLPAWSPDGRLAVVFGDAGSARLYGVLIVDPATDGGLWIDLEAGLEGYPAAWLDAARLAVPTRTASTDRPAMAILTVDTGTVDATIDGARLLAASIDGSTVAVVSEDARTVDLWHPEAWLAGDTTTSLGRIQAPDPAVIGAVALDRTGDHLALGLAVADASAAGSVRVLDGTDGWSVVADRTTLAGAPIDALAFVP
jgi:hypothetical protein